MHAPGGGRWLRVVTTRARNLTGVGWPHLSAPPLWLFELRRARLEQASGIPSRRPAPVPPWRRQALPAPEHHWGAEQRRQTFQDPQGTASTVGGRRSWRLTTSVDQLAPQEDGCLPPPAADFHPDVEETVRQRSTTARAPSTGLAPGGTQLRCGPLVYVDFGLPENGQHTGTTHKNPARARPPDSASTSVDSVI